MAIGDGGQGAGHSRRWVSLAAGLPMLFDARATSFLLAALPQLEGSPALQSLIMSLFLVVSGTAMSLLKAMLRPMACQV